MKTSPQRAVMQHSLGRCLLAAGTACIILHPQAPAIALPASSASVIIADPASSFGYDTLLHTSSASQYGASASSNIASGPTVTASGTSAGSFNGAVASLTYYLTFSAPVGVTSVSVDVTYSYQLVGVADTTANPGDSTTDGSLKITNVSTRSGSYIFNEQTRGSDSGTDMLDVLSLTPGTQYIVAMSVGAYGGGSYAFLDPAFTIDPAYLASSGYTASQFILTESDGVANGTTPVPEPASFALLVMALAGLEGFSQTRYPAAALRGPAKAARSGR